ncbi:class I mannose-6-phosphate isomerase [Chitinophaga barathri]|uniref:Mannose-6-phosphate isomerase n=1 Tax=Chitinophaga barathri TaxID=1647451 RepID=A0A3N4MG33_9BACT|nr:class I mannose-6-phosphate isomerase [Chitinophaga barathri]RPD42992.1 mannose-6-phosphate isomerase [Chitinophaga barathri]
MNKYLLETPNYEKSPVIETGSKGVSFRGWKAIGEKLINSLTGLQKERLVIAVECYHGVLDKEVLPALQEILPGQYFLTSNYLKTEQEIDEIVYPDVTDDEVFGFVSRLTIDDFFDAAKVTGTKNEISGTTGISIVYGCGASLIAEQPDMIIYIDMARWEIQQRLRGGKVNNIGSSKSGMKASLQYKRAFYVDWRVCDAVKKKIMPRADFILDTHQVELPKMVTGDAFRKALALAAQQPFRVVPFFDPGVWGGQWMKEYCDLDRSAVNYAWCFDCVPEENSLLFRFDDIVFETPAINVVYFQPRLLLGPVVQARFGDEFPIRFDFLDTMDGGNLSLQVHPTTDYARENFGICYTQDESYYLLDAGEDACVYLGLKEDANVDEMFRELETAQSDGSTFDAENYVEKWKAKKHDHVLIPAGTIHCSGKNSMVLEISATPFNFTFKLWDWGRLGLDGKPRPINIRHGKEVIDRSRTTNNVKTELINSISIVAEGEGWKEEKTGLHECEFIESRRHWFTKKVQHSTNGGVQVLNLVEGREAIVESPENAFAPFVVHYAETFIIPASVKDYTIRPHGESEGKLCATIKAFVRTNP